MRTTRGASRPDSAAEVAEVVRRAAAARAAIDPVGAGARRTGDPASARPRVLVSTRRLDHVLQLDETSLLVHVQAGLTGSELERILSPRGLTLGDYPPVVLTSSIGGILAVRTPGKSSARHGFFEDAVVGVSAVLADGRSVHTRIAPRRSTGPDLARALCGSEGTIGLLTSAVLRVHPKPEARLDRRVRVAERRRRDRRDLPRAARRGRARRRCASTIPPRRACISGVTLAAGTALLSPRPPGRPISPRAIAICSTSAVIAEGGRVGDSAHAELWWRRLHAGEPTPGPRRRCRSWRRRRSCAASITPRSPR